MWKYKSDWAKSEDKERGRKRVPTYKDGDYAIVELDRDKVVSLIKADLTIPQITDAMPNFTYEQIYDTILCDSEYWKSHTNLTHPGKYFRPSKVKIMRPTSPK